MILPALLLALGVSAQETRVRPVPDDNATQCARRVRRELLKIERRWGPYDFNCKADGTLETIFFPEDARGARDFAGFLAKHGALVDDEPVELADDGDPAGPALVLQRRGLAYHAGTLAGERATMADGRFLRAFSPPALGKLPADFGVDSPMPEKSAGDTALRAAKAYRPGLLRWRSSELVIEDRRCRDRLRPSLAWRVEFAPVGGGRPVVCFVDALNGHVCGSPPCRSASDPAAP